LDIQAFRTRLSHPRNGKAHRQLSEGEVRSQIYGGNHTGNVTPAPVEPKLLRDERGRFVARSHG
jgi:hypothetical protein